MTKEIFLTVRWNNLLTVGLGIPALIYVVFAYSTSAWTTRAGFIGLSVIGVLYGMVIEGHTAMRFAWLKKNSTDYVAVHQAFTHPLALIRKAYNLVFWIFLLPFFTSMEYSTGFIVFTIIIFIRLVLNLYTNNFIELTPEQFDSYPFRIGWIAEYKTSTNHGQVFGWSFMVFTKQVDRERRDPDAFHLANGSPGGLNTKILILSKCARNAACRPLQSHRMNPTRLLPRVVSALLPQR